MENEAKNYDFKKIKLKVAKKSSNFSRIEFPHNFLIKSDDTISPHSLNYASQRVNMKKEPHFATHGEKFFHTF